MLGQGILFELQRPVFVSGGDQVQGGGVVDRRLWSIAGMLLGCLALSLCDNSLALAGATGDSKPAQQHSVKAPQFDIASLRDPFSSYLERAAEQGKAKLAVQQQRLSNRKREPLEQFDLSTLKLVAIFKMGGERVAMVEDATSKGYVVRQGNYMGKHNGKVTRLNADSLVLVEEVLDPAGEIVKRPVTLTLNEVNP